MSVAMQQAELQHLHETHRYRQRQLVTSKEQNQVTINQQKLINFSSNDYLQLAVHPRVKEACIQGVTAFGVGSGASALVSGYTTAHQQLEEAFAAFLGRERAILFNSGYHANLGVVTALAKHAHLYVDRHCHASLIDGILLSRARYDRYHHNQPAHAEQLLQRPQAMNSNKNHSLIMTDSVFSIDGDICPLPALVKLAQTYQATLVVDDAHGIGVLGQQGQGISADCSQDQIDCLVTPLGKAIGSLGAIVSGSAELMIYCLQFARTYKYTTALPPAICYASLAALQCLQTEPWRLARLRTLIQYLINHAKRQGVPLTSEMLTPIKSILIPNNQRAIQIQQTLMQAGFLVACIRPPSSPDQFARLRISLNCEHQEAQISALLDLLAEQLLEQ